MTNTDRLQRYWCNEMLDLAIKRQTLLMIFLKMSRDRVTSQSGDCRSLKNMENGRKCRQQEEVLFHRVTWCCSLWLQCLTGDSGKLFSSFLSVSPKRPRHQYGRKGQQVITSFAPLMSNLSDTLLTMPSFPAGRILPRDVLCLSWQKPPSLHTQ